MPKPKPSSETRSEWMTRCVPVLIDEGREQDQAVAICSNMWQSASKSDHLWEGIIFKRKENE